MFNLLQGMGQDYQDQDTMPGGKNFLFNYSNGLDHRFKEIVSRDFLIQFFHKSSSPNTMKIKFWSFHKFWKICGDIRKSMCTTGINDSGGKFSKGINDTGGKNLYR
jgi:hypothetical protein